jgi:hypothetical protein
VILVGKNAPATRKKTGRAPSPRDHFGNDPYLDAHMVAILYLLSRSKTYRCVPDTAVAD